MRTDKRAAVGVEIAASAARIALVDGGGTVRFRTEAKTLKGRPVVATLEPYLRAIDQAMVHAEREGLAVAGLGVSLPGTIDPSARRPLSIPVLPSLNHFPLCDLLEARYSLPAQLHVDVDAALLGEHRFGVGKGFKRILFLTVNAVVGAALVIDGKIDRDSTKYVGHVSHLLVSSSGPRCSCGKRGCINTLVSMEAMQKMVKRAVLRGQETSLLERLNNRECFTPQLLAEEAIRGDVVAAQVYDEIGRLLGMAAFQYITIFEPDTLILGGKILGSYASEIVSKQVNALCLNRASTCVREIVKVVPARLGDDASLIGSVAALFDPKASRMATVSSRSCG